MSTCVLNPRKPKFNVTMADASSTFTASGYTRLAVLVEKN